jgi:hypothetical protein
MAILHLTLHRQWFDLIASGKKTIEYRVDSDYWHKRIFKPAGMYKSFNKIHFKNGYRKDAPLLVTGFLWAIVTHADLCHPANGEQLAGRIILIGVGEIIRAENYRLGLDNATD